MRARSNRPALLSGRRPAAGLRWTRLACAARIACAGLAATASFIPVAAQAQATAAVPAEAIKIDLPSQPLGQAIDALARQTGQRIVADPGLVAGRMAPALQATLTPREALQRLLADSGLEAADEGGALVVRPAAHAQLPPVRVSARADAATTEGTGSFTTGAMSTATGLDLSIRETPQSVSVITRDRIDDQALRTVAEVANAVTGVSVNGYDSARSGFSARGFDITNLLIDGLPTSYDAGWSAGQSDIDTVVYDRVEVVRGATGLTTGAGNPSAAINLVRKRADSKVFSGYAAVEAGSWNFYRGEADLSTPITADGSVRGRVVAAYESADSYVDLAETKRWVLYGMLDIDLGPSTVLRLGAGRQDNSPKGTTWGGLPIWYADGSRTDWDVSKTSAANWSSWSSVNTNYYATLDHRFDNGWAARLTYNRGEYEGDMRLLFLYGTPDRTTGLGMGASPAAYLTTRTQDDVGLFANGPFELFGRTHELGFGLQNTRQRFNADGSFPAATDVGDFNNWDGAYPEPVWGANTPQDTYTTTQQAGYAVARFSLADPLKLIIGARVGNWHNVGTDWSGPYDIKHTGIVTPYAGVTYDIDATYTAYASYSDIFQSQFERDRNGNYLDPIQGNNYEVGVKGAYFGGKLNAALALFRITQDNLAQADGAFLVPGTIEQAYYAAKGATSTGYEMEVTGELMPGWNASVGWSQFQAEDANDVKVNTLYPRKLLKLFTTWRPSGDWNKLLVGGGVNWQSENYTIATNPAALPERVEQGAYAQVDLMARYDFTPQWALQFNLQNLFDKKFYSQVGFYDQLAFGAPRNAQLALRYTFR